MLKPIIYEPMTVFTDLLIMVCGIWFALELREYYQVRLMNVHWHFSNAMWFVALAGLLGAVYHGLGPYFPEGIRSLIWKLTLVTIGFTSFALVMATFYHIFSFNMVQILRWVLTLLIIGYLAVIYRNESFTNAILFYGTAMVFILFVMLYSRFILHRAGTGLIVIGILVAFTGAAVQISRISLHKYFNYNDLYHLIQIVSMCLLYRGALLLNDYGIV
ncbi:MAG: hypothetical protein ACE5D2_07155 [Fidelibacterota bacterium]